MQCTMFNDTVTANADTMLMRETDGNCNPSIRLGTYNNVNLNQQRGGAGSRLLLRFTLSNDMLAALQPGGGFVGATLTIPLKPAACPGPCPSTPVDFSIFVAHSDWHEGQESGHVGTAWCARMQTAQIQVPWEVPGADGANDRSMMSLADVSLSAQQADADELVLSATPSAVALEEARSWLLGSQLSLILIPEPTSTGILYTKAREDSINGGGAQLTITSCR